MPRRDCPQCQRRLPYAARRCVLCGWSDRQPLDERVAARTARRRTAVWVVIALGLAVGSGVATLRAAEFADWYAGFAAQHLPDQASSYALADTERGAFLFCARRVARAMGSNDSVETFPSMADTDTDDLGDGRYRVTAWVDAARGDGAPVRHAFTCTVRFERGRWALENLEVEERYAQATPRSPAPARE